MRKQQKSKGFKNMWKSCLNKVKTKKNVNKLQSIFYMLLFSFKLLYFFEAFIPQTALLMGFWRLVFRLGGRWAGLRAAGRRCKCVVFYSTFVVSGAPLPNETVTRATFAGKAL